MDELDLIRRAIQAEEQQDDGSRPAPGLDWSRLVEVAGRHGVLAFVARSLKEQGWAGVPADVVDRLVAYRAALTARNLSLTRELLRILELLDRHGVTALPYKGPLVAAYAYGDLGMRPFADLDLIVSDRDVLDAKKLLVEEGYRSLSPRSDSERPGVLPPGHAFALRSADGRVLVELHWKLTPSSPLTIDDLLPGTRPFPLLGTEVPCLSPERFLLVLCIHGGKHAWERLEWVCGVAHLVARRRDLDWERLAAEAAAAGAGRAVALGLALATGLAGAPVPTHAMRLLGVDAVRALASDIGADLLQRPVQVGDRVRRYSLRLRAGTFEDRMRYLLFLRHPTEKDREFLSLPPRLSFLYFLVRPLRVVSQEVGRKGRFRRSERTHQDQAERARARQLLHQQQKADKVRGREEEMTAALTMRWDRLRRRLNRVKPGWEEGRLLEVGSGAHGILFGSGCPLAVGADPLAADYARLFPAWQCTIPTVSAEGERLPFAEDAFVAVLCDNVVDHAERPEAIVAEMVRVLAPGGLLYFTVNVHHRLYSFVARAHRRWRAAGLPLEIGPFADHTFHFTAEEARALFARLPLDIRREHVDIDEAKARARRRRLSRPGYLVPLVFFKNARFEIIAVRR